MERRLKVRDRSIRAGKATVSNHPIPRVNIHPQRYHPHLPRLPQSSNASADISGTRYFQPHGGSLRANDPANVEPTDSPARAPSVRNIAGGFRPTAHPHFQPHGGSLRANDPANAEPTDSPARAPSVRNIAGGFRPTAHPQSQPHGGSLRANDPAKRGANGLAGARTFGAKHSRGLPPNR